MEKIVENVVAARSLHTLEDIEYALVAAYIDTIPTKPIKGSRIGKVVARSLPDLKKQLMVGVKQLTLEDLVMCFETLVPSEEAKKYGAVFTPTPITAFMAHWAVKEFAARGGNLHSATVVDPAVGCGALLVAALAELHRQTAADPHKLLTRLHGIDISADSIKRAQLLLLVACLSLGDSEEADAHLRVGDTLKSTASERYDIVLANPPYVRYQQLDDATRSALGSKWKSCSQGNFNLYYPFFEVAKNLTKPEGVSVFITPNGFFNSKSASPLRKWLLENKWLEASLDFGTHRVFEAMTYTTITLSSHKVNTAVKYVDVAGLDGLDALPSDWKESQTAEYDQLSEKPWELVGKNDKIAIETISQTGSKLGEYVNIRYGLATLRDKLYSLDGNKDANGNYTIKHGTTTFSIEPELTKPVVKVAGMTDGKFASNAARVIFPYTFDANGKATVIEEAVLSSQYPNAYKYLLSVKSELAQRDKGKKKYPTWYAYGRSQGLKELGTALLTPLYAGSPRFMLVKAPDTLMWNGCALTPKPTSSLDLETLALILNSGVAHFFIESTSNSITGGFYAYQKTQLSALGIPDLTPTQVKLLKDAKTANTRDNILEKAYGIALPKKYHKYIT